ncbi:hypothetical protein IFU39_00075 [Paenibacillus sp. CFBP 13594]|uniref:hypothetical protein n=1 Tax=Paenibacillus sp. CFBP 13594 TaxID=2774037 RepID=UPI00177BFE95|nr:hypothetical protein [Paenibacillus sp. CFBP 13594]MBD8836214.1 hypothetical protein [Paenibacillus sp. CFBP 13594]
MGWSIDLISNKKISEEQVDTLVSNLPANLSFPLGNTKQPWGWATMVDITLKDDNVLWLSGSYGMSGKIAEEFALHISNELMSLGHEMTVAYRW